MTEREPDTASALNREGIPGLATATFLLRFYHFRGAYDAATNCSMPNVLRPGEKLPALVGMNHEETTKMDETGHTMRTRHRTGANS